MFTSAFVGLQVYHNLNDLFKLTMYYIAVTYKSIQYKLLSNYKNSSIFIAK